MKTCVGVKSAKTSRDWKYIHIILASGSEMLKEGLAVSLIPKA